jgi:Uma2 family endonuclease
MPLDDFADATCDDGYRFELAKGVIEVSEVPKPDHLFQVQELRRQLTLYQNANPDQVLAVAGSNEVKLLIGAEESERHPDLSIYMTAPPDVADVWSVWIPEIVVEVVSPSSAKRDYTQKPGEYLDLGVKEYWVVDRRKGQMLAMSRWRGQWRPRVVAETQRYATDLLPGFKLDLKAVFAAGRRKR